MQVTPTQQHAAIVYQDRDLHYKSVLHLAWHNDLRSGPINNKYRCVPCEYFDSDELDFFAEQASRLYMQNKDSGIPYGFTYTGASVFNGDLRFFEVSGAGLTCATFLLGFFDAFGFQILDLESWEARPDDAEWQRNIYTDLEKELSPEQVESVKESIGSAFRYRPEEVVGCIGSFDSSPFEFADAVVIGENLMLEVRA
jgi:hypothetical protein